MFRDESSKVMQKAHASWGVDKPASVGSPGNHPSSASSSSSSSVSSWGSSSPSSTTSSEGQSPPYRRSSASSVVPASTLHVITPKMYRKVEPTIEQKGLQFFLDRYLLGQPDAPANNEQLAAYSSGPAAMQNVMIAVGLAGLSNTVGDRAMNMFSRQKYTQALKQVQGLIAAKPTASTTVIPPLRIVVTLALFEVSLQPRPCPCSPPAKRRPWLMPNTHRSSKAAATNCQRALPMYIYSALSRFYAVLCLYAAPHKVAYGASSN